MKKYEIEDIIDDVLYSYYNDLFEDTDITNEKMQLIYDNIKSYTLKLKDKIDDEFIGREE